MAVNKIILNGEPLIDLTGDTVSAASLACGATAHDSRGELITGTLSGAGSRASFIEFSFCPPGRRTLVSDGE